MNFDIKDLLSGLGDIDPSQLWRRTSHQRSSKHMMANNVKATKAYKDDRQKAPHNRRKHGRRKRKK